MDGILNSVGYGVNVEKCINYCRIGRLVKLRVSGVGGCSAGRWECGWKHGLVRYVLWAGMNFRGVGLWRGGGDVSTTARQEDL